MAHWSPVDTMQDLVNKMGGESNIDRFLSGELVLVERASLKLVATGVFKHDMAKEGGWMLLKNQPRRINSPIDVAPLFKTSVKGDVVLTRVVVLDANYGQEDAEWLLEHQEVIPEELRKHWLLFPATEWQDRYGDCGMPRLTWNGEWSLCFPWARGSLSLP